MSRCNDPALFRETLKKVQNKGTRYAWIFPEAQKGDTMRAATIIMRGLAWLIITMLIIPPGIPAQDSGQPEQPDRFGEEELTQMLAPIALYPDSLIAQILMASTYPLELVEAERWMRQNKGLKGDELDAALQEKTWDASVQSLCHFPDVLIALSDKLDQTRKLGDAYLDQPDDVMATIQQLRRKAQDQGNLKTTTEQTVIDEAEDIRIEPADPQVVYVPVYDPLYVYGPWWYPAYPPYYWYYPTGVIISGGFITFGLPFFIGFDLFSWSWFDWPGRHIFVDFDRARHFHRHHRGDRDSGRHFWRHDPAHRRGVAYRDRRTNERFEPRPSRRSAAGSETRGYPAKTFEKKAVEPSRGTIDRRERTTAPGVRTSPERSQSTIERREGATVPRVGTRRERIQSTRGQDTPFSGVGNGSFERKASERGGVSRQSRGISRQSESIRQDRGTVRQSGETGRQTRGGGAGSGPRDSGAGRGFGR